MECSVRFSIVSAYLALSLRLAGLAAIVCCLQTELTARQIPESDPTFPLDQLHRIAGDSQGAPPVMLGPEEAERLGTQSLESELGKALRRIEQLESRVSQTEVIAATAIDQPMHDASTFDVLYDGGWTLQPRDPQAVPFRLKFEFHNQFRFTNFDAQQPESIDAAGDPRLIADRNDFDINRGRLVYSGHAFDEDLGYYVNIDYSTVASNSIQPLLAWISFRLSDRLTTYFGLGKVPGTWEWQQTSRYTLGVDRSLATTFFRPSISAGIWATGALTDSIKFTTFVGDGFNTLALRADDLDTELVYSGLSWWEPLGDFGVGFSDVEFHERLAARIGHGLTHTRSESTPRLEPGPEGTVIRLSDGTRLVQQDALRPDDRVNAFDIWLYTVHAGIKRRGVSVSGEYYFRWLRNLEGTSGREFDSLFDHGFFAQAAAFVIPEALEMFVRGSQVTGEFGTGDAGSIGANWYLFNSRNARATFELTTIDDSPAQQSRTGFVAGGSGTLVRAQLWTFF